VAEGDALPATGLKMLRQLRDLFWAVATKPFPNERIATWAATLIGLVAIVAAYVTLVFGGVSAMDLVTAALVPAGLYLGSAFLALISGLLIFSLAFAFFASRKKTADKGLPSASVMGGLLVAFLVLGFYFGNATHRLSATIAELCTYADDAGLTRASPRVDGLCSNADPDIHDGE
jgi:hypothetical protein